MTEYGNASLQKTGQFQKMVWLIPIRFVEVLNGWHPDGEEYAEVKAKDFVNGLKHAADNKSEALYLEDSVGSLADYKAGNNKRLFFSRCKKAVMIILRVYFESTRTILEL